MSDDIFEFDIDAALAEVEQKTEQTQNEKIELINMEDENDCEGCKI